MAYNELVENSSFDTSRKVFDKPLAPASDSSQKGMLRPKSLNKKQQALLDATELAKHLGESNVNSIGRLVEIFGVALVAGTMEEALKIYAEAEIKGAEAYRQPDTAIATIRSKPRTRGGVFFYLMRKYCDKLGLDWTGLRISSVNWYDYKARMKAQNASSGSDVSSSNPEMPNNSDQKKPVTSSPDAIASNDLADSKVSASPKTLEQASYKPARIKTTIVGSLVSSPRLNPQNREGLIELRFKAEMSNSLPKVLPNLGESEVVIWCTNKQFDKVAQLTLVTLQTRFIVEGEPMPAVGSDFAPFLRVMCTRLTTVELEQQRRSDQSAPKP